MFNFIHMKQSVSFSFLVPLILFSLIHFPGYAQTSDSRILPYSFYHSYLSDLIPTYHLHIEDAAIQSIRSDKRKSAEIGVVKDIQLDLRQDAVWEETESKDRICRIKITAPRAKGIVLYYKNFKLAPGAYFHIYTPDRKQVLGAYTAANNYSGEWFSTEIIQGDQCILEYFEPRGAVDHKMFEPYQIGYIFKDAKAVGDFGQSASCHINANCVEGNNYRGQQKSVCRILIKEQTKLKWCTGTLINNTRQNCTPYILTAFHCAETASESDYLQWIFYHHYEGAGCSNPAAEPIVKTTQGCMVRARSKDGGDTSSDFALYEMTKKIPTSYDVTFSGWRKTNVSSLSGVTIHHPFGDIKKISTYKTPPVSRSFGGVTPNTHWQVFWSATANGFGVTQEGSSGAPLYDANGFLIGTLTGGAATCENQSLEDYFGKFSEHFNPAGASLPSQRLIDWLDADLTAANSINLLAIQDCTFESGTREINQESMQLRVENGILMVKNLHEIEAITLFDLSGKILLSKQKNAFGNGLDLSTISKGTYIMAVQMKGEVFNQKLLID